MSLKLIRICELLVFRWIAGALLHSKIFEACVSCLWESRISTQSLTQVSSSQTKLISDKVHDGLLTSVNSFDKCKSYLWASRWYLSGITQGNVATKSMSRSLVYRCVVIAHLACTVNICLLVWDFKVLYCDVACSQYSKLLALNNNLPHSLLISDRGSEKL